MAADLRPLHRRALAEAGALVDLVQPGDLVRASPCAGWDLAALLDHMVGQHHGFGLAVESGDAPAAAYAGPGPSQSLAAWPDSVRRITLAFTAADLTRPVRLVEISAEQTFPAAAAIGFQLLDTVVHAWDVATALGRDYRPDEELLTATARLAAMVPGGPAREQPGAAFGPERPAPEDAWAAVLARLGRSA